MKTGVEIIAENPANIVLFVFGAIVVAVFVWLYWDMDKSRRELQRIKDEAQTEIDRYNNLKQQNNERN